MKQSEVIRETKCQLFERGWQQDAMHNKANGHVCLVGALHCAIFGQPQVNWDDVEIDALLDLRTGVLVTLGMAMEDDAIAGWNDAKGRTFTEVIDVLDAAEKFAERQEAL